MSNSDLIQAVTAALTLAAVIVSMYTIWKTRRLEHETASQTLIHDQYELCRVLDEQRVEFPETSHVLVLPVVESETPWTNYLAMKRHVGSLFPEPVSDRDRAKLYLQEQATALHVCDIYEQTLLQHKLAKKANDETRKKVLTDLIAYYETCMLRNPRLRYHWHHGARDMMEPDTRESYDKNVDDRNPNDLIDFSSPLDAKADLRKVIDVAPALRQQRKAAAARLATAKAEAAKLAAI